MPVRSLAAAISLALLLAGLLPGRALAGTTSPPTKGALYSDGQTGRYLLGGTWLFRADPAGVGTAQGWWRDSAATGGWARIGVPSSDNAGDLSNAAMEGTVGWYRRDFTVPKGAFTASVPVSARRWIVRFESVNYSATVWLNGHRLGSHTGANLPFEFDLNLHPGVNRMIVRVDNRIFPGQLPPGPGGGWWNYGGILREVYLRRVESVDITSARIRPQLQCPSPNARATRCPAEVGEQVMLRNLTEAPQTVRLSGRYGSAAVKFPEVKLRPHGTWTGH